jgi:hypothetical protein
MCHIMGRLAHIPQILEKLGSSTLLARSVMARTRGPRRTEGSCRGATKIGMLHPTIVGDITPGIPKYPFIMANIYCIMCAGY